MARTTPSTPSTPALFPYAHDLEYLEHELNWLRSRCLWVGAERRLELGDDSGPLDAPSKQDADERRRLQSTRTRHRKHAEQLRADIDARRGATTAAGRALALDGLCERHGLLAIDRLALLMAAAPCFSSSFGDLFGLLEGSGWGSSMLTPEILFNCLQLDYAARLEARHRFSMTAPLLAADLLSAQVVRRNLEPEDLLTTTFKISSAALDELLGDHALGDALSEFSSLEDPLAHVDEVVLDPADKQRILAVVENHDRYLEVRREWGVDERIRYGRGTLMLFHGRPGTGKTMMAHGVAARLGKKVLNVDIPTFIENRAAGQFLPALFRAARAHDAILFFDECETLFMARERGNALMTLLLAEIERFEGVAILATNLPDMLDEALLRRILVRVRFPEPDREARAAIWRHHLPPRADLADDVDVDALAARHESTGGYIKNAILTAVADAVRRDPAQPQLSQAILARAIEDQLRLPAGDRHRFIQPSAGLDDLVLPASLHAELVDLLDAARNRSLVLDRWGIGRHLSRGRGIAALLYGEPGTGKTLCAEVVARELNRPLLICDLAELQSKWVGETEKNITAIFEQARSHAAVLLFDEADALLTRRGDGHASRHDDAAVNVLLQRIERHDGVVLLTTNLAERLDPALERRLAFKLRFPLPDARGRSRIWRGLLPDTVPVAGVIDFDALGRTWALSGGLILNAVLEAAQRAAAGSGVVTQALLEQAAQRQAPSVTGPRKVAGFGA